MNFVTEKIEQTKAGLIICFMYEDESKKSELFEYLNKLSNNELQKQIYEFKTIKGAFQEIFKYSINEKLKVIVAGLGKKESLTRQKFSQVVANAARSAKTLCKNKIMALELIENKNDNIYCAFDKKEAAKIILCAARIGLYEFSKYLKTDKNQIETLELIDTAVTPEVEAGAQIGAYTSFAMKFTKDLVNESAQIVTPDYVANLASQIAHEHKLELNVFNKKQIKELKMNAFLAVGQGSVHEPKFIHLIYKPKTTPRKKIALVGKGITFDAGGMNIKPAASMLTMKSDMTGAATVLGIIQAIAKLEADIELHIISALCENMTSGSAYKQGDVLTAMNGKTIEVDNREK